MKSSKDKQAKTEAMEITKKQLRKIAERAAYEWDLSVSQKLGKNKGYHYSNAIDITMRCFSKEVVSVYAKIFGEELQKIRNKQN